MQISLVTDSQRSDCLCLPSAGVQGIHQHTQPFLILFFVFEAESHIAQADLKCNLQLRMTLNC